MNFIRTFCFLILLTAFAHAQTTWSVAYETPWGTQGSLNDIDMATFTHIIHVGGCPNADSSIVLSSNFATKSTTLISLAHAHGVKVLYSVGDTSSFCNSTGQFGNAVTGNLSLLVTNIMSTVNTYGYDGVDIDWEASFDVTKFDSLLSALRTALGSNLLTTALSSHWEICSGGHASYTSVDRIDVMAYDQVGQQWSVEWFNAPLYKAGGDVPWSVNYMMATGWYGDGCAKAKLNMGLPFYGYTLTGGSVTNQPRASYGGTAPTQSQHDYNYIVANYNVSSPTYDSDTHAYWVPVTGGYLTYDPPAAITEKLNYVVDNGYGGWFTWNLNTDYVSGTPHHLLHDVIKQFFVPAPSTTGGTGTNIRHGAALPAHCQNQVFTKDADGMYYCGSVADTWVKVSPLTSTALVALFSTCSGTQYLGADGACHTALLTSANVVGAFTSCSGTQYLGADGACHDSGGVAASTAGFIMLPGLPGTTNAALSSITTVSNQMDCIRFISPHSMAVTHFTYMPVTSAGSGSHVGFAIYDATGNATRLMTTGALDGTITGTQTLTVSSFSLVEGTAYLFCWNNDASTATTWALYGNPTGGATWANLLNSAAANNFVKGATAGTAGAPPATLGSLSSRNNGFPPIAVLGP